MRWAQEGYDRLMAARDFVRSPEWFAERERERKGGGFAEKCRKMLPKAY